VVRLRCLLVDDSEEFLASASRLLGTQGVTVAGQARSGAEAVRLAAESRPDVALVDVDLGEELGFDVAVALATAAPATRVILISTYPEEELADLLASSPAIGFLSKTALGADTIAELVRASAARET
jgi:DNA-binding NarL/FixJ family response regulator